MAHRGQACCCCGPVTCLLLLLALLWAARTFAQDVDASALDGFAGIAGRGGPPAPLTGAPRLFMRGMLRHYGKGIAAQADELTAQLAENAGRLLSTFSLGARFFNKSVTPHVTPGLEEFDVIDQLFGLEVYGSPTFPQPFTAASAAITTRLISKQLQEEGFDDNTLLLWTRYLTGERNASSPIAISTQPAQDVYARLEVSGEGLLPFTLDKQTLLLSALQQQYIDINAPVGALNVSSFKPLASSGSRRLMQAKQDTLEVFVFYTVVPPPATPPSVWFSRILGPGFRNLTASLGLAVDVAYDNATLYTGNQQGTQLTVTCEPASSGCQAASQFQPQLSSGSRGSGLSKGAVAGIVVGVLGFIVFVLLIGVEMFVLVRRRRRLQQSARLRRCGSGKESVATSETHTQTTSSSSGTMRLHAVKDKPGDSGALQHGQQRLSWLPWRHSASGAGSKTQHGSLHEPHAAAEEAMRRAGYPPEVHGAASSLQSSRIAEESDTDDGDDIIPASEIEICKRPDGSHWALGEGAFGKVYKALWNGHREVAVKQLTRMGQQAAVRREMRVLRRISSDSRVVQFHGAVLEGDAAMLVFEYMAGGDLQHALANDAGDEFAWGVRGRTVAIDFVRGLCALHSCGVIHRDVKASNILLDADGRAKLADVGLAKLTTAEYFSSEHAAGTFAYAAPELLLGHHCSSAVDIYSAGVVLWELVTKQQPARGQLGNLADWQRCPPEVVQLFWQCLGTPAARPTAPQLLHRLLDM